MVLSPQKVVAVVLAARIKTQRIVVQVQEEGLKATAVVITIALVVHVQIILPNPEEFKSILHRNLYSNNPQNHCQCGTEVV